MKKQNIFKKLKSFFLLLVGQSVSQLGTSITSFAILIWVYTQNNAVTSVALLSVCTLVPYIFVGIFGGAITDRINKKKIMLVCDLIAAMGSFAILFCFSNGSLEIWHLYILNAVSGFMNAFQGPASEVTFSLMVPKEDYTRVNGVKSVLSSGIGIIVPVLASAILAFGGLKVVLIIDLCTFLFAFITLIFIKIPEVIKKGETKLTVSSLKTDIKDSFAFLKNSKGVLYIILFFGLFNFIGSMSFNCLLSPMILAKTGNNEISLGIVSSFMAFGGLCSGFAISILKPAKNRIRVMFASVASAFLISIALFGAGNNIIWWCITSLGSFGIPIYFAYEGAILRENVPITMQGKIFSIRGILMQALMPIGYLLGGILADNIFEPFMISRGYGNGSGMGLIFIISGLLGFIVCLIVQNNKHIKALDKNNPTT